MPRMSGAYPPPFNAAPPDTDDDAHDDSSIDEDAHRIDAAVGGPSGASGRHTKTNSISSMASFTEEEEYGEEYGDGRGDQKGHWLDA